MSPHSTRIKLFAKNFPRRPEIKKLFQKLMVPRLMKQDRQIGSQNGGTLPEYRTVIWSISNIRIVGYWKDS